MKTLKSLTILASVAAVFATVSCTKEDALSVEPAAKISTITLSIEQPTDESATKTQLGTVSEGSYPINWTKGDAHTDAIAVGTTDGTDVVKYTLSSVDTQDATKGTFTGETVSGEVKAFYPYADVVSAAEGVYNVNIPSVQTYTGATSFGEEAMPMYAVASSTGNLSSMKPLMSVLKITLSGSCTVKRIIISNASEKLSGSATVAYTDESATLAFAETGANDYVELVCPSGVNLGDGNATFHIVVPATVGTDPTKYTVRVVTDESKVMKKTFTPTSKFTAAKIKNLTNVLAVSPGTNVQYVEGSYCGDGITIGSYTWAPVNCGYDATNYTYGLLYQWGRHDGCGYNDGSKCTETLIQENYSTGNTQVDGSTVKEDATKFYWGSSLSRFDWLATKDDTRWNSGTEGVPVKTTYDPCPEGWRVPTLDELCNLCYTDWNFSSKYGTSTRGYWDGTKGGWNFDTLFLPAAGYRDEVNGNAANRGETGSYWSSSPWTYDTQYTKSLFFMNGLANLANGTYRARGCSVRCVQE